VRITGFRRASFVPSSEKESLRITCRIRGFEEIVLVGGKRMGFFPKNRKTRFPEGLKIRDETAKGTQ
jgi:hypothetical protein